jgi:hypothetical protein
MPKGGARAGSGRPPGALNKRTAEVRAASDRAIAQLKEPFEGDGYALLAMVYKDKDQPLSVRLSAAGMAMPYERPRLSNVEMTTRSLDKMSDEEFFRAWDSVARFLEQHGRPQLLEGAGAASELAGEPASSDEAGRDTTATCEKRRT